MRSASIKLTFGFTFLVLFVAYVSGIMGSQLLYSDKAGEDLLDVIRESKYDAARLAFLLEAARTEGGTVISEIEKVSGGLDRRFNAMKQGGAIQLGNETIMMGPAPEALRPEIKNLLTSWQTYQVTMSGEGEGETVGNRAPRQVSEQLLESLSMMEAFIKEEQRRLASAHQTFIIVYSLAFAILSIAAFYFINRYVSSPIEVIRHTSAAMASGKLMKIMWRKAPVEISEAMENIDRLRDNLEKSAAFAVSIGNGTFDKNFTPAGEDDELGAALLTMSEQLQQVDVEDTKRRWVNEGLANFANILREERDDLAQMCHTILSNLVKYLEANQGGLFVVEDSNGTEAYLELMAVYAYERKKYQTKTIKKGEGLVGQAWLEGDIIYMTEVPEDYVLITSGIGESTPRSMVIVPLKLNEEVLGVLEIASFREYEEHERNFLLKLSESIASTLSSVKVAERTRNLLVQSQQQSEEMRAQEEEMRQNMEELQATQENMERKEREHLSEIDRLQKQHEETVEKFKRLSVVADNTDSAVVITGADGLIQFVNPGFERLTGYGEEEVLGMKPGKLLQGPDTDLASVKRMGERLAKQQGFYEEVLNYRKDGKEYWVALTVNPVFENGVLTNFVAIQADISDSKKVSQDFTNQLKAINMANLVVEFDTNGYVLDCNENFLSTMEYDKASLIGQHHSTLVPEDEQDEAYRQMWQGLAAGKPAEGTFMRIKADGSLAWLKSVYTPIMDFKGRAYKVMKYAQDVSGQVTKQEEMRQTLEQAVDAVITINSQKEIEYMNSAAVKMFGYTFDEVKGQNVKILVPDEHKGSHDGYVDRNMHTGENKVVGKTREVEMQHKNGKRFWGLLSLSKINIGGEIRYTSFIKNIQEQKELEIQVRQQFEAMQESEEEIRASEEELRQNMEEMMAIQEDMERVTRNYSAILDQAVDAVITIDTHKNISFFNEAAEKMFGFTGSEVKGRNVNMIVPMEHREQHDGYIDNNVKTGKNKVVGKGRFIKARHKDGKEFEALLTLSKVKTPEGYQFTAFIKSMDELRSLLTQMEAAKNDM
ncbi:PAS domain S-box protein [Roseivirga sp. BDSF3-8]|uniref:PAS domain S-box protein n=1 Tax=Roseivirga sp. BDSF3-8 TaxID=3241598 RepID=UPI003531BE5A